MEYMLFVCTDSTAPAWDPADVVVRMTDATVAEVVAEAASEQTAQIISTVIRMTGDFALAEDCVQDAFAKALVDWRSNGVPANSGGWLTTVARNRAVDLLRRAGSEPRALARVALEPEEPGKPARREGAVEEVNVDTDDRLRLIFTCCHPWLPMDARVARTLRTVAGLGSAHIARAKIKNAGIPYRVPPADRLPNAGKECVQ